MPNPTDSDSTKIVQTELAIEDYQRFRDLAAERDLSLKTAMGEPTTTTDMEEDLYGGWSEHDEKESKHV